MLIVRKFTGRSRRYHNSKTLRKACLTNTFTKLANIQISLIEVAMRLIHLTPIYTGQQDRTTVSLLGSKCDNAESVAKVVSFSQLILRWKRYS